MSDRATQVPEPLEVDPDAVADAAPELQLVEDDLLVEDVSIDGMCGVY